MKKCIALDIDGTLFYSKNMEFKNSVKLNNGYYTKVRPFLDVLFEYLKNNSEYYETIIYSAAKRDYIEEHLKILENKDIIKNIYDRKHCDSYVLNNKVTHIKNAKNIKYDISSTYLIDDNKYHFDEYEILGYKCKSYRGEDEDFEVFEIINFLETLKLVN